MQFPIVIRSAHFPFRPYGAITLFFFIVVRKDCRASNTLMRHEMIHFRQQLELLIVVFALLYYGEMLWYFIRFRNIHKAYRNISFEREAYNHEHEKDYLKHRRFLANYRKGDAADWRE